MAPGEAKEEHELKITGVEVVAPSLVEVGEEFSIGVKVLTDPFFAKGQCYGPSPAVDGRFNLSPRGITYMDNVPPEWRGELVLEGGLGYAGPGTYSFADTTGPYPGDKRPIARISGLNYSTGGSKVITARDPATGASGISNPLLVCEEAPEERLYWGDIHSQTFFTDGLRSPEELYHFARDEAFLDIFALADHSEWLTDRQWEYFVGVTNDFNQPHEFVTLVGLEWSSHRLGHRNIYYPGEWGPILRSTDPVDGELPAIYAKARAEGGLIIPHHSANVAMGVDWTLGHDPEVERLVEIYSVWGNSERPEADGNTRPIRVIGGEKAGQHVVDALALGRRFGIIGGGDIHDGRPGDELHAFQRDPDIYPKLYGQGLMGVWARELTRESVFEAMRNRHVYATTNVRLILRFSIDGHRMGSEVEAQDDMEFSIEAVSEVEISHVDLVRNGRDYRVYEPSAKEFQSVSRVSHPAGCYYVRVTRIDGEMAWSSPIWVEQ